MLDKNFQAKQIEEKLYKDWMEHKCFMPNDIEQVSDKDKPFTLMMPPPNVTGSLHMGHALTFTIQDILVRYQRMQGKDTLWQSGQDHAGIATQSVVEKLLAEEGTSRHDVGREKFIERVWQWRDESGGKISRQLQRLGASADWSRDRFTMDEGLSNAVRYVFVSLYEEGLIYRDKRLVNWDPKLHTAISDLEVENKEVDGNLWHFSYPLVEDSSQSITIATTRPETLFGDTAIAVHPDDERYTHLIGKKVRIPLCDREIEIITDEYADPETGSGAVKITPGHDFNDFEVGQRNDLEIINIFDDNAALNENVPEAYQGMDRFEARKKAVEEIEALGLLVKIEPHKQQLPFSDRSGAVVEPKLTDQWFADAHTLAQPAIEAVKEGRTKIVPEQWERNYFEWMNNIQPWCISRQIWWGHQIPAWFGPDNKIFVAMTEEEAYQKAKLHYGKDDVELTRETDVLDTWFSSALWPFSTLGWPCDLNNEDPRTLEYRYPTDVLVTGFDILFFWVARMMMMGLHFKKDVPFKHVYIHALVRDEKGQKMSKSKGNVIDPLDLMDEYGVDALRFTYAAMASPGRDIKMSPARVEGYRNFATKLWNATRFCQMNNCTLDPDFDPVNCEHPLHKGMISQLLHLEDKIHEAIAQFRFNDAAHELYHFAWHLFCDWYVELCKPMLMGDDEHQKIETQKAVTWVLNCLLHYMHPFIPFVTESLWQEINQAEEGEFLMSQTWPDIPATAKDESSEKALQWVIDFVTKIRSTRSELNIAPTLPLTLYVGEISEEMKGFIYHYEGLLKRIARLDHFEFLEDAKIPEGSLEIVMDDSHFAIPLADVIDFSKEKQRLEKESEKISGEAIKLKQRLSNDGFLQKAPQQVIQEQNARLKELESMQEKVKEALNRLQDLAG